MSQLSQLKTTLAMLERAQMSSQDLYYDSHRESKDSPLCIKCGSHKSHWYLHLCGEQNPMTKSNPDMESSVEAVHASTPKAYTHDEFDKQLPKILGVEQMQQEAKQERDLVIEHVTYIKAVLDIYCVEEAVKAECIKRLETLKERALR